VTAARTPGGGASGFRHVVFDLDGTLLDTGADLVAATNHVLATFDVAPVAAATLRSYVGDGARTLVARALGPERSHLLDAGVERFLAHYRRHLLDETRPYPGMEALVAGLHGRGVRVSVVTNKAEALSRAILGGLGWLRWVESLVGGDSLPTRKPHPAGLERVLALAGTAHASALMVGDSVIDRDTAAAAGVPFCGVAWGFASEELRAAAPAVRLAADASALAAVIARGGTAVRLDSQPGSG
jgi:phosphoglycolate phosphatase